MTTEKGELAAHVHIWLINKRNVGTCSLCGEVRQFPWDVKAPVTVLKGGNYDFIQVPEKDQLSIRQV